MELSIVVEPMEVNGVILSRAKKRLDLVKENEALKKKVTDLEVREKRKREIKKRYCVKNREKIAVSPREYRQKNKENISKGIKRDCWSTRENIGKRRKRKKLRTREKLVKRKGPHK